MITYKSNKFSVINENIFEKFCSSWGLSITYALAPDDRVGFKGTISSQLTEAFWIALGKHLKSKWTATSIEYELTTVGFTLTTHTVNSKGDYGQQPITSLKFKDSVTDKKRKKYLNQLVAANNILIKNKPYSTVEASS